MVAESGDDERRVALVPKAVVPLTKSGVAVVVESGAGQRALLPDELYTAAGASIGDAWAADIVVKVAPPTPEEVRRLHRGQTLIGFLAPRNPTTRSRRFGPPGFRPSRWRQSRGSRGRSRWTRCPPKPTSPDTRRCCWPHGSRPGSFRC
ncbi:alanine dehydrogenase/PNT, N-terminal domain protein [Mycobacterium xenopi 4042]|uniref:proton-translocating NAD(P)(+) transhydrogenase n=1 Tax=Mycobacterium xenopi 4042 TaxID=1299334 RepID=X8BL93_MYCXE|nr:alanine dehydrogenase/PNT, N-terminal domain protein [Mycobacterium xenopi 4042]